MSDLIVRRSAAASLYLERGHGEGSIAVSAWTDDPDHPPILVEFGADWGTTSIRLTTEDARAIGGALIQTAERLEANDESPAE